MATFKGVVEIKDEPWNWAAKVAITVPDVSRFGQTPMRGRSRSQGTAIANKATATTPAAMSTVSIDAASDILASKFIGMTVYTASNENIGDINDLLFDKDGKVKAVIVGVGGFLGMGEKDVALPLSQMNMTRDENGAVKLTVTATREELNAAPAFDPSVFNPKAPADNTTTTPATPGKTTTGG